MSLAGNVQTENPPRDGFTRARRAEPIERGVSAKPGWPGRGAVDIDAVQLD